MGWAWAGAVAIVAASVVGSVLWFTRPADTPPPETVPTISGDGASLLLIVTDREEPVAFALLATHPDVDDRVLLFPPGLLTVLPGFGSWELDRADAFGGPGLSAVSLTNLTGARVDGTVRVPVEAIAGLLDGAVIELDEPILRVEGDDQVVVVAAGNEARDAERIAVILGEQGVGDQLAWLVRQGSVIELLLEGIAATAGEVDRLLEVSTGDLTLARDVLAAVAGDPGSRITAAQVRPIASLGGSEERYQLAVDDAEAFIEDEASYLLIADGPRPRVEVLNGTERVQVTPPIAAELVEAGYRIVRTDNADRTDYAVTRIVGHTEANQSAALSVFDVLGFGEVRLEVRQPSGIVDITVIVGDDFQ
ncbi:MAG: LytR C-terminal domain-containing protein [Acidimicrobiia bacterium]|nr:LytR C-terminal domain-containing protein [Acidimicrobiia bacterium]